MTYDSTAAAEGSRLDTRDAGQRRSRSMPRRSTASSSTTSWRWAAKGWASPADAIRSEPLSIVDLDALIAYLRKLPQPVRAPTELRIVHRERPAMSETVRVFVNGTGYDATAGGTALDAVALHAAADAERVRAGALLVTDSRGLPSPPTRRCSTAPCCASSRIASATRRDPAARFDE